MGLGKLVAVFVAHDDFLDFLICDLVLVEKVDPDLFSIFYPVGNVNARVFLLEFFDLFLTPDFLVRHNSFYNVLNTESFVVSAFHIFTTDPATTTNTTFLFNSPFRLELPNQEICIIEKLIWARAIRTFTLIASTYA